MVCAFAVEALSWAQLSIVRSFVSVTQRNKQSPSPPLLPIINTTSFENNITLEKRASCSWHIRARKHYSFCIRHSNEMEYSNLEKISSTIIIRLYSKSWHYFYFSCRCSLSLSKVAQLFFSIVSRGRVHSFGLSFMITTINCSLVMKSF